VFERYTELGRRSIYFAHYEASAFLSPEISTEALLLGILREDPRVGLALGTGAVEAIRKELEPLASKGERISPPVDLPLTMEAKSALEYATEEADALDHKMIDTPHLVLGLLRVEGCLAATLLRRHGLDYKQYRDARGR
jgi:ATP-dependent Clp protease ATP-binding subunit ClpC